MSNKFNSKYYIDVNNESDSSKWKELHQVIYGSKTNDCLDESLDEGTFTICKTTISEPYKPYSRIKIDRYQDGKVVEIEFWLLESDAVSQICFEQGNHLFKHEIKIIELSKELQFIICDTITFTNYVVNEPLFDVPVIPLSSGSASILAYPGIFKSVDITNPLISTINSEPQIIYLLDLNPTAHYQTAVDEDVTNSNWPNKHVEIIEEKQGNTITYNLQIGSSFEMKNGYNYTFNYIYINILNANTRFDLNVTYQTNCIDKVENTKIYTIPEVVDKILGTSPTRLENESQKYKGSNEFNEKYKDRLAPQFFISRKTVWEALLQVGYYIHAIPYLKHDYTIDFLELGGNDEKNLINKYITNDISLPGENYCSTIDSIVENILNTQSEFDGAVVEPYSNGYKTTRVEEEQVIINNDSAMILTQYPIYKILKVECGYTPQNFYIPVGDLTAFIYEATAYQALFDYENSSNRYRTKGYALYYSQGDNKIKGFQFQAPSPLGINQPAITNIIQSVSGSNYVGNFKSLAFRITYTPLITIRMKQKKAYIGEGNYAPKNISKIYQQEANTVQNIEYGQQLVGTIEQMGLPATARTYNFIKFESIPSAGQLVRLVNKLQYVSRVEKEYMPTFIKATIEFTPNFNRVAQSLALNSDFRLFNVPESNAVQRLVVYDDDLILGDDTNIDETIFPQSYVQNIIKSICFINYAQIIPITAVYLETYQNGVNLQCLNLPVASYGIGNALIWWFSATDNYGVGYQQNNSTTLGNSGAQRNKKYGDDRGMFDSLRMVFLQTGNQPTNYNDQVSYDWVNNNTGQAIPNTLPQYPPNSYEIEEFKTKNGGFLVVKKDSREQISITYQVNIRTNRNTLVIGSQFSQKSAYVNQIIANVNNGKTFLYKLTNLINGITGLVDLSNAEVVSNNNNSYFNLSAAKCYQGEIVIGGEVNGKPVKAWAWLTNIDNGHGEIIYGENESYEGEFAQVGASSKAVYFNMKKNQ